MKFSTVLGAVLSNRVTLMSPRGVWMMALVMGGGRDGGGDVRAWIGPDRRLRGPGRKLFAPLGVRRPAARQALAAGAGAGAPPAAGGPPPLATAPALRLRLRSRCETWSSTT